MSDFTFNKLIECFLYGYFNVFLFNVFFNFYGSFFKQRKSIEVTGTLLKGFLVEVTTHLTDVFLESKAFFCVKCLVVLKQL